MALLTDSSTNNFQLSAFGDVAVNTTTFKYGGGSAYFDGNGDYLLIPAESDCCAFGTNNFTIEWWEYIVGWSGQYFPILHYGSLGDTGNFSAKIGIRYESSGGFMRISGNGSFADFNNLTTPLNTWRHCALVREGNSLRLYRDGTVHPTVHNINWNITQSITDSILGGAFFGSGGGVLYSANGYLDDLRVTNGVARYTSDFTPPTEQLPAPSDPYSEDVSLLLHMDGLSGSQTFTDSSTNNFTLTAFGNAQIDTSIKKFGSGAAYFDGSGDYLQIDTATDPMASVFNFLNTDFTVECWINAQSGARGIISTRNAPVYTSWIWQRGSDGKLWLLIRSGSNTWYGGGFGFVSNTTIPLNEWVHIAWVCSNNSHTVYINGVADSNITNISGQILEAYAQPSNIYIGTDGDGAFNGYIDEFRITKGVARYTSDFVPQTAPFVSPAVDPWSSVLNSSYGSNIIAAYDFRDYNGTDVVSKIGPDLQTSNVTVTSDGLTFTKGSTSWAFANSTVTCSYPFTMVYIANTNNTISTPASENVLINCSATRFGSDILVFTRTSQSLMPYNGQDNQVTGYLPNGTEWYFYAVSFLNNGTCRFATRKLSGNLNGVVSANNGSTFNGYPGVAAGFNNQSLYGTTGTYRLAVFINQAFSTESDMDYLFNTIASGPGSDLLLQ